MQELIMYSQKLERLAVQGSSQNLWATTGCQLKGRVPILLKILKEVNGMLDKAIKQKIKNASL